jgi:HK97 family phage portal protein
MFDWLTSLSWNRKPTARGMNIPSFGSVAGEQVTHRTASTVSSYYAAIRNVSEDIGKIPSYVIRLDKNENKTHAKDLGVYKLLTLQANPMMTAMSFKELLNSWAQGWGNGFAQIEFSPRMDPIALWPIHPARVQPYITEERKLVYYVYPDFDIRGLDVERKGEPLILEDWQMIHIKGPSDYGIWGKSVLETMAESLGISIAAQKFGAAFYGNGAHAGGYLVHPTNLSVEAGDRLRDRINKSHRGAGKSGSIIVLEEGMDFKSNTVSPKDAQALELRQFEVSEIARWFRIQPHKIQDLTRATYSNIESQNLDYCTDTLLSWSTRWSQELQIKLFFGDPSLTVNFDFDFLLQGDRAGRASFYSTLHFIGALNVNEIRKAEGWNNIGEKGDEYYQQSAMIPLGSDPMVATQQTVMVEPDDDIEDDGEDLEEPSASFSPIIKAIATRVASKEAKACEAEKAKNRDHSEFIASFWPDQVCFAMNSFLPIIETMHGMKLCKGPETIAAILENIEKNYDNKQLNPSSYQDLVEVFSASKR